jgi:hypothetical protein
MPQYENARRSDIAAVIDAPERMLRTSGGDHFRLKNPAF